MDAVKAWEYVTRGHVLDVSISASGEHIVAGSQDAYLYMFDKTGRALWGQNLGTPVLRARISPNGEYIATSTYDNIISFFSKAGALLGWRPRWPLETALERTVAWTKAWRAGGDVAALCREQIAEYEAS